VKESNDSVEGQGGVDDTYWEVEANESNDSVEGQGGVPEAARFYARITGVGGVPIADARPAPLTFADPNDDSLPMALAVGLHLSDPQPAPAVLPQPQPAPSAPPQPPLMVRNV